MDGYVTIGTKIDTSGIESGLTRIENKLDKRSRNMGQKFSAGFLLGFSMLTSVLTKFLEGFANSMDSAISRVDTMNNFSKVMVNLGQSAEESQLAIDYLSEKLTGLPTALDQGVSAVQRFTSANNNVKASTEMFLALNNAILAGGAPMQQQAYALEQLSQAYARGKPDLDEWQNALITMPAQLKQVAEVMGYTNTEALGEALRSGEVSMNEFMATLVKMNHESINGFKTLEEQARTGTGGIQTSIANLRTAFTRGMADILQAIGQTNITNFFQTIINAIKAVIPYIAAFVRSFMVAVTFIGKAISTISNAIGKLFGKKGQSETKEFSASLSGASVSMGDIGSGAGTASDKLGKASKSAKELKKQLAGFDEMNVLQDTTPSSGGGAGGGSVGGGVGDLGSLGDIGDFGLGEIEKTLAKVNPLLDWFVAGVWGLVGAFGALKLLDIAKEWGLIDEAFKTTDMLRIAVGIGVAIAGVVLAIQGLIKYLKDPSWKNFGQVLQGISIAVIGIGIAIGGLPVIIVGVIALIIATIIKYWDEIKAFLSKGIDWLASRGDWIRDKFGNTIGNIYDVFITTLKSIVIGLDTTFKGFKQIFDGIIQFIKGVFTGNWKQAWEGVKKIAVGNFEVIKGTAQTVLSGIVGTAVAIAQKIGDSIASVFKAVVNGVLRKVENFMNGPIDAVNRLRDVINKVPGINLGKLPRFNLPRLAKGGIINLPGSGVAIGGESGREGVIPLTDSQQMELLGEAIGKYITVNASITNTMNGRVISRELQKINNENDFAFNR